MLEASLQCKQVTPNLFRGLLINEILKQGQDDEEIEIKK